MEPKENHTAGPVPGLRGNDSASAAGSRLPAWVLPSYCALVVYGTLFPVGGWELPADFGWRSLLLAWPEHISRTDLLTNFVIYVPLGALWIRRSRRPRFVASALAATLIGAALSYGLECAQIFLPRVPSRLDLLVNTLGSLAGGVGAALTGKGSAFGEMQGALRGRWFHRGRVADVGLLALVLWALSQLAPLVPSLDVDNLKNGLRPLWSSLNGASSFDALHALEYLLAVLGLGLLTSIVARTRVAAAGLWTVAVFLILVAKVPIMTRQLSLEALAGSAAALALLPLAVVWVPRRAGAASLLVGAVLVQGLRPAIGFTPDVVFQAINWVPLAKNRLNLFDFADLLGGLWPFVALAYLSRLLAGRRRSAAVAVAGGAVVAFMVLGIEWAQQRIPGRVGDATDALAATAGWFAAWGLMSRRHAADV